MYFEYICNKLCFTLVFKVFMTSPTAETTKSSTTIMTEIIAKQVFHKSNESISFLL